MSQSAERFVLVVNGRSGSTLLADLLRSHPAVDCKDELLNESYWPGQRRWLLGLTRWRPLPYLARQAARSTAPVYGFKLKTGGQVRNLAATLNGLRQRGWRLIALQRRDALQQTFSWSVAQASGRWQSHRNAAPYPQQTITLEVDRFMRDLRTCLADRRELGRLMAPLPHLSLIYEDDLQSSACWPATGARICAFLGIEPAPLTSCIVRTWERPYTELVANYQEILAAVDASPWANLMRRTD